MRIFLVHMVKSVNMFNIPQGGRLSVVEGQSLNSNPNHIGVKYSLDVFGGGRSFLGSCLFFVDLSSGSNSTGVCTGYSLLKFWGPSIDVHSQGILTSPPLPSMWSTVCPIRFAKL